MKQSSLSYFPHTSPSSSKFKKAFITSLALTLCIVSLLTPAMALSNDNGTLTADSAIIGQGNVSEYNHLIEVSLLNTGYIVVSESMVYLIESSGNPDSDQTQIKFWIPENAEIMQFQVTDMAGTNSAVPVNYTRGKNYLYFDPEDNEASSGMPLLYGIRYVIPDTGNEVFQKVIHEDGELEQSINRLITVVYHSEYVVPKITSAEGKTIMADETVAGDNYTSFEWSSPQFEEFNIVTEELEPVTQKQTRYNSGMIIGILLFIAVIGAVLYYKKKDSRGNSKDISELQDLYDAEMAVIARIKHDRKNNKLSQEEYDKLEKRHGQNASKIKKEIEKMKKT
nr:hypothetical protein [uncultured Methanolobus sp.]